jgi:hypothetical protein
MSSTISFIDEPIFDSIIAYCWTKEVFGQFWPKIDFKQNKGFYDNIPLKKHKHGYFIASSMFYKWDIDSTEIRRRRWHSRDDNLAFFGKNKRKVQIDGFEFKSRSIPYIVHSIPEVWFYFDGDPGRIESLVKNHLPGIGKDIARGHGFFDSFEITKSDIPEIYRPIPVKYINNSKGALKYCAWQVPYYCMEKEHCQCPVIKTKPTIDWFEEAGNV